MPKSSQGTKLPPKEFNLWQHVIVEPNADTTVEDLPNWRRYFSQLRFQLSERLLYTNLHEHEMRESIRRWAIIVQGLRKTIELQADALGAEGPHLSQIQVAVRDLITFVPEYEPDELRKERTENDIVDPIPLLFRKLFVLGDWERRRPVYSSKTAKNY
jgi:hypothetical protein